MPALELATDFAAWKAGIARPSQPQASNGILKPLKYLPHSIQGSQPSREGNKCRLLALPTEILDEILSYAVTHPRPILVKAQYFSKDDEAHDRLDMRETLTELGLSGHIPHVMAAFYHNNAFSIDISCFSDLAMPAWPHGENYDYPHHDSTGIGLAVRHVRAVHLRTDCGLQPFIHAARVLRAFEKLESVVLDFRSDPDLKRDGMTAFEVPEYRVIQPRLRGQRYKNLHDDYVRVLKPFKEQPAIQTDEIIGWNPKWFEKPAPQTMMEALEIAGVNIGTKDGMKQNGLQPGTVSLAREDEERMDWGADHLAETVALGAKLIVEQLGRERLGIVEKKRSVEDEEWDLI